MTFKRVDFGVYQFELATPLDNAIVTGYDHTIAIMKDGKVFAWGCYTADEKQHFKPVHVPFFDKYNVVKVCSS